MAISAVCMAGWAERKGERPGGGGNLPRVSKLTAPLLTETLNTVAAGVDDGVVGHAGGLEGGAEDLDVGLLVLALVPLGVGGVGELAGLHVPRVPAGDVGGDAAELRGAAGSLVDRRELLRAGLEVVIPAEPAKRNTPRCQLSAVSSPGTRRKKAEKKIPGGGRGKGVNAPATVAGVEVHDHVGKVEGLEGVGDALAVALGAVLAGLEVDVCDQVGEGVGLDDEGEGRVGLALEDLGDGWEGNS